jgi:hypothetical protein
MKRFLPAVACVLCTWPLLAQGGFDGPGRYEISNVKSGKVLDLDRNDQTTVIQFSSRGTDNQSWFVRPAGAGYFYLRNGMNGYALDADGGGNNVPVQGMPFTGGENQQWRLDQGKDGNALIVSRLGRGLDIPNGSTRDGVRVQLFGVNGDSNQRFFLRRVSGPGGWDERDDRGGDDRRREDDRRGGDDRNRPRDTIVITCSSNHGERVYCEADTRNGARLSKQISGTPCIEGSTWGADRRGVWVDHGCRAEFTIVRDR